MNDAREEMSQALQPTSNTLQSLIAPVRRFGLRHEMKTAQIPYRGNIEVYARRTISTAAG
jgi:hypothetical protein